MGIEKENYGVTKEGKQVTKYTLTNGQGASVSFLDYGAVIQSIIVPDKDGKLEDVVLGYDTLSGYESNVPSFGSPVGRCANRISNACFVLMVRSIHWIIMMLQTVCMAVFYVTTI